MISLSGYKNQSVSTDPYTAIRQKSSSLPARLISEVNYYPDKPWITQRQVLPLLRRTCQQARWQLWLTPGQKLSRSWLQLSTLPIAKMMQARQLTPEQMAETMARALQTGNYSVVIGWFPHAPEPEQYQQLALAAQCGNAPGILIRPQFPELMSSGLYSETDNHCGWYH